MTRLRLIITALLLALSASHAPAQEAADPVALFEEANGLFEEALDAVGDDSTRSRELFLRAAATYEACADQGDLENHLLHTNTGNAWLFAGDHARAIVWYRRALRLDPTHGPARRGLEAARAQVRAATAPEIPLRPRDLLLAWRPVMRPDLLLSLGLATSALFWLALAVQVSGRTTRRWPLTLVLALVTVYALAAVSLDAHLHAESVECVEITADEVVGRTGPDHDAYQAAFNNPLTAGVEGTILERRSGWLHVRLRDARTAWVPAEAATVI